MSLGRTILKTICALSASVTVCAGSVAAIAPAFAADGSGSGDTAASSATTVNNVVFQWGVNPESGGGAYFGGCNALSAGTAGDSGGSGVWTADKTGKDGKPLYRVSDESAHATILKPDGNGTLQQAKGFTSRCTNRNGTDISGLTSGMTKDGQPTYSENVVQLTGGTGTIDAATNSADISWKGASFTIVYYGGMTYWSISDPVLHLDNGKGTLTGTASGYGADMNDASKWDKLQPATITLADFQTGTQSGATTQVAFDTAKKTITAQPDYLGITADAGSDVHAGQAEKNAENASWWGSFPSSWLTFNVKTGQSSYWYTSSGGANSIQPRKVASPITITWDAPAAEPTLTPSATTVEPGQQITFTAKNLDDGKTYDALVRNVDNPNTEEWKAEESASDGGTRTWKYTVPANASGTYTFELREHGAADGSDPLLSAKFTVGVLPGAPRLTNHDNEGTDRVELFWNAPMEQPGNPAFTGFKATAKPSNGGDAVTASYGSDERSGMITGLKASTKYDVTLVAVSAIGESAASNTMTITTTAGGTGSGGNTGDGNNGGNNGNNGGGDNNGGNTDTGTKYENVTLRWGMNDETNSAAYYGGCNFMSAGKAGNTGSATSWSSSMYKAKDGNVSIQKPNSAGKWTDASWDSKCLTRDGDTVKMATRADGRSINSESQVVLSKGTGVVQSDGSVEISWTGSWTVAYYGGMTYWSVTDPKLTLDASGNGSLTATASGYGASMSDSSKWVTLSPRTIHVADFKNVDVKKAAGAHGFTKTPEYLGVAVKANGDHGGQAAKDSTNAAVWGSFPQSFVDFQVETGQSAYWYTANSPRDFAKVTLPLSVQYDSSFKVDAGSGSPAASTAAGAGATASGSGLGTGGGLASVGSGVGSGDAGAAGAADDAAGDDASDDAAGDGNDPAAAASTAAGAADERSGNSPLLADNAKTIAIGSGSVAAATALPLGLGWFIRRRLGLDPSAALDSRLGL